MLTHAWILEQVWGRAHREDVHYLRVLVRSLRRKLGESPEAPRFVHTVPGVGYRLEDREEHDGDDDGRSGVR